MVAICLLGIVVLLGMLIFRYLERNTVTLDSAKYKYVLKAGIYEVGAHVPAGAYKIKVLDDEEGYFNLHDSVDTNLYLINTYRVIKNEKSNDDSLKKINSNPIGIYRMFRTSGKVKEVTLEEGQFVNVQPDTILAFFSNDIENDELKSIHIDKIETYYVSEHEYHFVKSNAVAGVDFPVGVYDIIYKPVKAENSGTIECNLYFSENGRTLLFECDGKEGEQIIFRGVPFTLNSSITTNYLDKIELVPTEYIGKAFNDITWNAQ